MSKLKFRIPMTPWIAFMLVVLSPILVLSGWDPYSAWLWTGFITASTIYSLYMFVLEIDATGVRLYRVNMLRWDDVNSARIINLFGLRYLFVKRHKGMNYWIPLYFKGDTQIEVALRENAPTGNPIASCF